MPEVYVGAGSNVEPRRNLAAGLVALAEHYGILRLSPVYQNQPVGFEGEDFLNLVVAFQTDDPVEAVSATLAAIEADNGRTRAEARMSPRTLDLDLLLYGDLVTTDGEGVQLPREEITRYPFVLKPLADLAGAHTHPRLGRSFRRLWEEFDDGGHELVQVEVDFAAELMP